MIDKMTKKKPAKKIRYSKVLYRDKVNCGWFISVGIPMTKELVHFAIGLFDAQLVNCLRKIKIKEKEITNYIAHRYNQQADGRCTTFNGSPVILVRIMGGLGSSSDHGNLVHELLHSVHRLMEGWGKTKVFDNKEEVMCCLMNHYYEQIINTVKSTFHLYGNVNLTWEDTHYMEFNYANNKKNK